MIEFIQKFWIQTALTGIVGLIVAIAKYAINRFKKEFEEQDLIKYGVLALLHDRLYQACHYYIAKGEITASELNNIEHLYKAYRDLGGNGTGTELFNRCKALRIKPEGVD